MGRAVGGAAEKARVIAAAQGVSDPAKRTSRPQVLWSVTSKLECRELVWLLRRYPLRGRRRREFALWAAAVDRWAASLYGFSSADHEFLRTAAGELRRLRRYVDPGPPSTVDEPEQEPSTDGLPGFLGGFFTGEGAFSLQGRAAAVIHLRADDTDLLRTFRDAYGIGCLGLSRPLGANPSVRWTICRRAELPRAIAMLDAACLRGRKRREFEAWRVGAAQYARGRDRDEAVIAAAAESLARAQAYVHRDLVLPTHEETPEVYVDVLRACADELSVTKLTCTAYARAREGHPEWPARNTITLAFGSWKAALAAAGLSG